MRRDARSHHCSAMGAGGCRHRRRHPALLSRVHRIGDGESEHHRVPGAHRLRHRATACGPRILAVRSGRAGGRSGHPDCGAVRHDLAARPRAIPEHERAGAADADVSRAASVGEVADDHPLHRRHRVADRQFQRDRRHRDRPGRDAAVPGDRADHAGGAAVRAADDVENGGRSGVNEKPPSPIDQADGVDAPHAKVHLAKWSPWLWIVPALAIFLAGWLIVRYGFFGGGDITVRFADARGLDRYSPVRFRGAKVGTIQKITIDQNLRQVVVRISMDASMNHALKKGTRFWIVEPGLEGGGLGGLLSGTYVGIAPGEGDQTHEFLGQEYAPVLSPPEDGKTVVLEAHGLGSIAIGSPVTFQGLRVGTILGAEYDETRGITDVHAFIVKRFAHEVRQSTRFWRAGGLNISLSGAGLSSGGASISSLLNAPVAFYTPETLAGDEVAQGTHFDLYDSEGMAMAAADGPQLTYVTHFPGPVHW